MWEHDNQTPFAADHAGVRDKHGAEVWIVVVKATFLLQDDGKVKIAPEQEPATLAPQYRGDPAASSLLHDSDVHHTKPTTDVVLHGNAYAPNGKPATQVDVTMKVGPITKTLRVTGDRFWRTGASRMTDPEPFTTMPLTYERAFGGHDATDPDPKKHTWDVRNPVGVGFAASSRGLNDKPLPNVEDPKYLVGPWSKSSKPAGFGPLAGHWQPRVKLAGTYGEKWLKDRQPLLPEDFDERFYLCAPEDQQTPTYLKGGEPVELVNLMPGGRFRMTLPRFAFRVSTRFAGGEVVDHRMKLHTVSFDTATPRLMMVWHTHLPCHHNILKLERSTITLKQVLAPAGEKQLVL